MARKRMFSLDIIDTDLFLEMPQSSRLLYYELCMRADDDGFVSSPKKIMRVVGCSEDDFKVLITKQFLIPFDTGVVVIKHWKIHNYIQNDRYKETIYTKEKSQLIENDNKMYTKCIQVGDTDKISIDKISIDKNNIYSHLENDFESEFDIIWKEYPRKQGKKDALRHYIKARKKGVSKEKILQGLNLYNQYIKIEKIKPQYIKQGSTWFNQECWNDDYSIKREITTKDLDIDISDFFEEVK